MQSKASGALSAKANLTQDFCFVLNFFFIYMFSCSLCVYLSLVLNGTPGVLKLVVVTHRVVLFSLPFSSACFSDGRGRRAPPPLMTSCSAHARSHLSTNVTIDPHASVSFSLSRLPPKSPISVLMFQGGGGPF